jgi:hypothetical protein
LERGEKRTNGIVGIEHEVVSKDTYWRLKIEEIEEWRERRQRRGE